MEVVASLSEGRTAAAQCGLFTYKSVPVIFEPSCILWQSWEVEKQRRTKIFVATPSHRVYVQQGNDLFMTWNHVLIKCF